MTTVVLDSADLVQATITGTIPVPKGIAEDNASQAAKRAAAREEGDPTPKPTHTVEDNGGAKPTDTPAEVKAETPAEPTDDDPDDIEGEDGLTPRQKRDFTKSMLATLARKTRAQKEAEELATSEYNRGRLAEQRAEALARENARLKEQLKPAEVIEDTKPTREKFETEEAFRDAMDDWRVDQKFKARDAEQAKQREEQQQAEVVAHAAARIEHAIELVPDFKDVTEAVDMPVPPHIANYMQRSELFAELGYHFAKHPEVLEKLTEFTVRARPGSQAMVNGITDSLVELGKIASTLQPFSKEKVSNGEGDHTEEPSRKNGEEPSRETGSAPSKPRVQAPIIRPLNAGSGAQVGKSEEEMQTSEVISAWQRKHGVKLTARKRH